MNRSSFVAVVLMLSALYLAAAPASFAAKSPAMEHCSGEWAKMKSAGTIPQGETWPKFWSQCSKDYAAQNNPGGAPAPAETTTSIKKKTSTETAAVNEEDSANSGAQKKACDAKWRDYKSQSAAHGWKAYFTFMARCM